MQITPKIHLAQMGPISGKPFKNFTIIRRLVEDHAKPGDIIAFPEMAVGGYLLGDLWLDTTWCRYLIEFNDKIAELSRAAQCTIIYGNIYLDETRCNKDGRPRKLNAAYVVENGKFLSNGTPLPTGVVSKTLLPNYRFFDDQRYFISALDIATDYGCPLENLIAPFTLLSGEMPFRIGVQLCEDLWCADYKRNGQEINTASILNQKGADIIINLSASPWTYGKANARDRRIQHICSTFTRKIPYAYVNRTGAENCGDNIVTYDGGTTVYDLEGTRVAHANSQGLEEVLTFKPNRLSEYTSTMTNRDETKILDSAEAQKCRALIEGLRHTTHMLNLPEGKTPKFVIGVSGGVDSCLVLCLLEQAFGKENVTGITMPGEFTTSKTLANAYFVTRQLGVNIIRVNIHDLVEITHDTIDKAVASTEPCPSLHIENEIARTRGSAVLAGIAARLGALYTCNGNKLETALGYATLYGDVNGAIAVLGDVDKTEVIAIAKYLNTEVYKREVIPLNLFPDENWQYATDGVAPSAELAKDQIDPMKFGYHDALLHVVVNYQYTSPETILKWFLTGQLEQKLGVTINLLKRWGLTDPQVFVNDLEWFFSLLRRNIFKRIQAPPIIVISKSAFGYDRREAILTHEETSNYYRLREQVLAKTSY